MSTGRERDPLFEGLTGLDAAKSPKAFGDALRLTRDTLFGDRRDKTKAIAEHLGVSPRHARRLMAGQVQGVKDDRADQVNNGFRSDPKLRQAALGAGGKSGRPGKDIRLTVTGNGGPIIGDSDHSGRQRPPIDLKLTPEQFARLQSAFVQGGSAAAFKEINSHGDSYFEDFRWSKISNLEVR